MTIQKVGLRRRTSKISKQYCLYLYNSISMQAMMLFYDRDFPSKYQAKSWGTSFALLMKDELGQELFEENLQKEFSVENLDFYRECVALRLCPKSEVEEKVKRIFGYTLAIG